MHISLTRTYKDTVAERAQRDPAFARALLDEASTLFLNGEAETARLVLRDLVNATIGFEALGRTISKQPKSLHRMLSERGNPSMDNIAAIFQALNQNLQVQIKIQIIDAPLKTCHREARKTAF